MNLKQCCFLVSILTLSLVGCSLLKSMEDEELRQAIEASRQEYEQEERERREFEAALAESLRTAEQEKQRREAEPKIPEESRLAQMAVIGQEQLAAYLAPALRPNLSLGELRQLYGKTFSSQFIEKLYQEIEKNRRNKLIIKNKTPWTIYCRTPGATEKLPWQQKWQQEMDSLPPGDVFFECRVNNFHLIENGCHLLVAETGAYINIVRAGNRNDQPNAQLAVQRKVRLYNYFGHPIQVTVRNLVEEWKDRIPEYYVGPEAQTLEPNEYIDFTINFFLDTQIRIFLPLFEINVDGKKIVVDLAHMPDLTHIKTYLAIVPGQIVKKLPELEGLLGEVE